MGPRQLHLDQPDPLAGRSEGQRVFTFPTAGRFLAQFGVGPVTRPYEYAEVAMQTGALEGVAWSGITEDDTADWAGPASIS
ncbi:hypothetical protein JMM61_07925 [Rhodovulum sulfidophilum]|nr:hypothetical protein [Rhodovulum sulfidophilum]